MDGICFFAPTGAPIIGLAQEAEGAWEVLHDDPTCADSFSDYTADGPDADWESVSNIDGEFVWVDGVDGQRWLTRHLFADAPPLPDAVVNALRQDYEMHHRLELVRRAMKGLEDMAMLPWLKLKEAELLFADVAQHSKRSASLRLEALGIRTVKA